MSLIFNVITIKLFEKSSAIRAQDHDPYQKPLYQEEALDPYCESYVGPLAVLFSWDQSILKWNWMSEGSLQSRSLAGSHSSLLCGQVSELQISLVGEPKQFGHCVDIC